MHAGRLTRLAAPALSSALFLGLLTGCGGGSEDEAGASAPDQPAGPTRQVVLYAAVDQAAARTLIDAFEVRSGIEVVLVGDTDSTRTVPLASRLESERGSPQADVWWSVEPYYTVRLAEAGVLEPFTATQAEADFGGAWPTTARAADGTWYGFARSARVIAYDTRAIDPEAVPQTLRDLAEPEWNGKVGMARPLFGTTVGHLAALTYLWGEGPTGSWLSAMESNGLRLYDSNTEVVRAIADGEIELGLTDSAAVWAAKARNAPVGLVYEAVETEAGFGATPETVAPLLSFGPLTLPNTVARVRGGPNPDEAAELIEFLLSAEGERLLMGGPWRFVPVRLELADELGSAEPRALIPNPAEPEVEGVADSVDQARAIVTEVLGL